LSLNQSICTIMAATTERLNPDIKVEDEECAD